LEITGKVAIVTGGGSGIGRATALALAQEGAKVVVADIDPHGGEETVRLVRERSGDAAFARTDVTSASGIEQMVATAVNTYGGLHILHNNAGVNSGWPAFPDGSISKWEPTLAVNLWAVLAGTQIAIPAMKESGGGAIVNTASLSGLIAYRAEPVYAATKHAVVGLTRALGSLKDEANIRVNCVCPAFVDTELPRRRLGEMREDERRQWEQILERTPMIQASEVAAVVVDLVRDDSASGRVVAMMHGQAPRDIPAPVSIA
jgi:NAD(P)-dependent dehydrogenase (short-subunit alcohol dehydrogenase family)